MTACLHGTRVRESCFLTAGTLSACRLVLFLYGLVPPAFGLPLPPLGC